MRLKILISAALLVILAILAVIVIVSTKPDVEMIYADLDYSLDHPAIAAQLLRIMSFQSSYKEGYTSGEITVRGPYLCYDILNAGWGTVDGDIPVIGIGSADYHIYADGEKIDQVYLNYMENGSLYARGSDAFRHNCEQYGDPYCVFGNLFFDQFIITKKRVIPDPDHFRYPHHNSGADGGVYYECPFDMQAAARWHGREMLAFALETNPPQTYTLAQLQHIANEVTT